MERCEHCAGQRFDRAQVLRTLRAMKRQLPRRARSSPADAALAAAIKAVREMEIPHLDYFDEIAEGETLH
jgi:hypothetical protein